MRFPFRSVTVLMPLLMPAWTRRQPRWTAPVRRMTKAAMERGLYLFVHWNIVMIAPPLNITREELDEGLGVLDEVLAIADEYAGLNR